jgi:hypothetical protein
VYRRDSRYGAVANALEIDNKPADFIKGGEFLD